MGKEERIGNIKNREVPFPPKGKVTGASPVEVIWGKNGGGPRSKRYLSQKTNPTGNYRYAQPYSLHNASFLTNYYFGFNFPWLKRFQS